ncbi:hypothetical protein [Halobacteriovorax sp. YZS-1-1]|uniref:hypothetical protein n=2 Tax=unclassified Halobacteriovorax TaxID=2639665 RepID=UPI00399A8F79
MMKILITFLMILVSQLATAECRQGIVSIFTGGDSFADIAERMGTGFHSKVGKTCVESIGSDVNIDSYCECVSANDKADYSQSRKIFRQRNGKHLKGSIFMMARNLVKAVDQDLELNCKLHKTLNSHCSEQMINEMFPEYVGKDFASELGIDFHEIFSSSVDNTNNTISKFRTNSCQSLIKNDVESLSMEQSDLDNFCVDFNQKVKSFCSGESITSTEKDDFEFELPFLENVDSYNYYCKIKDRPKRQDLSLNIFSTLSAAYKNNNEEANPRCEKICKDKAPYSIHGCNVDKEKALSEFVKEGCTSKENQNLPNCLFLKEAIGNQLIKDIKSGSMSEEDISYLEEYLHKDDFDDIKSMVGHAKNETASLNKGSLVSQFFESKDGESFDIGGTDNENIAQEVVENKGNSVAQGSSKINSSNDSNINNVVTNAPAQQTQQGPVQQSNLNTNNSGRLTMGSRGRGRRKVSARTKQMVETIKTLREAGSSLKDAIAAQDRRMKKEREELARANREKYQRYDAETLEPIRRSPSSDDRRRSNDRQIANVGSPTSGSGGSNGMSSGAGGSGGTGSSTFLPPEKKATVVDITGRSAPELDLNNLQSSGATLPASITNHPDASEISKMFNGLEYKKDSGRGPASKDDEIKKIKVDWSAKSIDLGSLLINAKDIKPGEEFILYKGDMDQYVRLVPSYTFRRGKKVFIGYRIDNRSSENADLASSIFAKKFLIL